MVKPPIALPSAGMANQYFEPQRVDFSAATADGRAGGVQAGFPLWLGIWSVGTIGAAKSDEIRAFMLKIRGAIRWILGRDLARPFPLAHLAGFSGMTRPDASPFDGSAAASAAAGDINFSAQPAVNSTITINGTLFTFVASGATGAQINIGADLTTTIGNAVTVLNTSSDANVTPATYSNIGGTKLHVAYDATGAAGNAFTLAASTSPASNGTASGATLSGGAPAWSETINSDDDSQITLHGLPPGLRGTTGDYIDFVYTATEAEVAGLEWHVPVRMVEDAVADASGVMIVTCEPPVPKAVPLTAVAHLDNPQCVMRLVTDQSKLGAIDRRLAIKDGTIAAIQDIRS